MKIKSLAVTLLLMGFSSVGAFSGEITVAVAANVQYTFEELKAVFEKQTDIKIKTIIGSSGKFTTQIENGAPFDIFLSADMDYPKALEKEGLTYNSPKIYVYGTLVLWTMNKIDLANGIQAVLDPAVRKVAIASPNTAPYGRQAVNALKNAGVYKQVSKKFVYGENIAQTSQFISTGASEIGFTAKSVVLAANMKDQGQWIEVDRKLYEPIAQGAVILKYAERQHLEDAQTFYTFLFSKEARDIYQKYGYLLP